MNEQQTYLSKDLVPRLAAIDIGSNSIRLVVAEALTDGRYRILDEERESTRLGRALASSGNIDEESMVASLAALRRFKSIAEGFGIESQRAIATCAVREAKNGEEFVERVRAELGLEIEVISGEKEAHFAFQSVRRRFDLSGTNTLLADIGGGSTEFVLASGDLIEAIYATKLGAVRLAEKFGGGQALAGDDFKKMVDWIDRELKQTTEKPVSPLHMLIGSGGTFTNLANMVMASKGLGELPAAGYQLARADVRHLVDRLRKMTAKQRREVPGLNPDRVDIIVPGITIVDRIMRRFKVNLLQVHDYGVRDGLLLTMIDNGQGPTINGPPNHDEHLDRFAEACGVNLTHSKHVANLAVQIYAGLAKIFDLDEQDLPLLEAAGRLQDVGYLINYEKHHKHSYHLILHSRLEMFRPQDLQIIANVARYHRGAQPKNKHANFKALNEFEQKRVRQMSAVLRLAGGLDRSHNQTVQSVEIQGTKQQVDLLVSASEYPEVNLWAARRRAGPFEKIFETELNVQWAGRVEGAAS